MTVKAVTYWEIRCDGIVTSEGALGTTVQGFCRERPDDDYSAWSEKEVAEDFAHEAGWGYDEATGQHWCPEHTPKCEPGKHVRKYEDDRCTKCGQWPEDDEEMDQP